MNYYIQGDAANADQIKAAFERNGINTSANSNYGISNLFYFSCNGEVAVTQNRSIINIIKTHPDYKELELPVEPCFKVGDEIYRPARNEYFKIKGIEKDNDTVWYVTTRTRIADDDKRICEIVRINARYQNDYCIAPKPNYDIKNFHAGMPVLARDSDEKKWLYTIFGMYNKDNKIYPFVVVDMRGYTQCIPFEGNEHLLGTTDMPSEKYINW